MDLTVDGDGTLTGTAGHRCDVADRGWPLASDLRVGDRLRTPDGSVRAPTALRDRAGMVPRTVHDLTVDDLRAFCVLANWITAQWKKPRGDIFDPGFDLFPIDWMLRGEGSLGQVYPAGAVHAVALCFPE
ncbi:hypothetical protein ACLQ2E_05010 [Streptomyces lavendulocolor]